MSVIIIVKDRAQTISVAVRSVATIDLVAIETTLRRFVTAKVGRLVALPLLPIMGRASADARRPLLKA